MDDDAFTLLVAEAQRRNAAVLLTETFCLGCGGPLLKCNPAILTVSLLVDEKPFDAALIFICDPCAEGGDAVQISKNIDRFCHEMYTYKIENNK